MARNSWWSWEPQDTAQQRHADQFDNWVADNGDDSDWDYTQQAAKLPPTGPAAADYFNQYANKDYNDWKLAVSQPTSESQTIPPPTAPPITPPASDAGSSLGDLLAELGRKAQETGRGVSDTLGAIAGGPQITQKVNAPSVAPGFDMISQVPRMVMGPVGLPSVRDGADWQGSREEWEYEHRMGALSGGFNVDVGPLHATVSPELAKFVEPALSYMPEAGGVHIPSAKAAASQIARGAKEAGDQLLAEEIGAVGKKAPKEVIKAPETLTPEDIQTHVNKIQSFITDDKIRASAAEDYINKHDLTEEHITGLDSLREGLQEYPDASGGELEALRDSIRENSNDLEVNPDWEPEAAPTTGEPQKHPSVMSAEERMQAQLEDPLSAVPVRNRPQLEVQRWEDIRGWTMGNETPDEFGNILVKSPDGKEVLWIPKKGQKEDVLEALRKNAGEPPIQSAPEAALTQKYPGLTPGGSALLETLDAGGVPAYLTNHAEQILQENGITPAQYSKLSPEDAFGLLRSKAGEPNPDWGTTLAGRNQTPPPISQTPLPSTTEGGIHLPVSLPPEYKPGDRVLLATGDIQTLDAGSSPGKDIILRKLSPDETPTVQELNAIRTENFPRVRDLAIRLERELLPKSPTPEFRASLQSGLDQLHQSLLRAMADAWLEEHPFKEFPATGIWDDELQEKVWNGYEQLEGLTKSKRARPQAEIDRIRTAVGSIVDKAKSDHLDLIPPEEATRITNEADFAKAARIARDIDRGRPLTPEEEAAVARVEKVRGGKRILENAAAKQKAEPPSETSPATTTPPTDLVTDFVRSKLSNASLSSLTTAYDLAKTDSMRWVVLDDFIRKLEMAQAPQHTRAQLEKWFLEKLPSSNPDIPELLALADRLKVTAAIKHFQQQGLSAEDTADKLHLKSVRSLPMVKAVRGELTQEESASGKIGATSKSAPPPATDDLNTLKGLEGLINKLLDSGASDGSAEDIIAIAKRRGVTAFRGPAIAEILDKVKRERASGKAPADIPASKAPPPPSSSPTPKKPGGVGAKSDTEREAELAAKGFRSRTPEEDIELGNIRVKRMQEEGNGGGPPEKPPTSTTPNEPGPESDMDARLSELSHLKGKRKAREALSAETGRMKARTKESKAYREEEASQAKATPPPAAEHYSLGDVVDFGNKRSGRVQDISHTGVTLLGKDGVVTFVPNDEVPAIKLAKERPIPTVNANTTEYPHQTIIPHEGQETLAPSPDVAAFRPTVEHVFETLASRSDSPSDTVKQLLTEIAHSEKGKELVEARMRGPISMDRLLNDLAVRWGEDLKHFKAAFQAGPGSTFPAEGVISMLQATDSMVQHLADINASVAARTVDPVVAHLDTALATRAIQALFSAAMGATSESGRTLRAIQEIRKARLDYLRTPAGMTMAAMDKAYNLTGKSQATWDEVSRGIITMMSEGNLRGVYKLVKNLDKLTKPEAVFKFWMTNLLSNPGTHILNLVSTAAHAQLQEVVVRPLSNLLAPLAERIPAYREIRERGDNGVVQVRHGFVSVPRQHYPQEIIPAITHFYGAWHDGLMNFLHIMRDGFSPQDVSKLDFGAHKEFHSWVMQPYNYVTRLLAASDALNKAMSNQAQRYALATSEGMLIGHREDNLLRYVAEHVGDPNIANRALEYSKFQSFNNDPEYLAKFALTVRNFSIPILKTGHSVQPFQFSLPFVKTVNNILARGIDFTPAGMPKGVAQMMFGDRERGLQAMSSSILGSAVMMEGINLFNQGLLTGAPPLDRNERERWYAEGKQPYSIKIGDKWYGYQLLYPISFPLFVAAAWAESFNDPQQKHINENNLQRAGNVAQLVGRSMLDMASLTGFSNLMDAFQQPERFLPKAISDVAGGFAPFSSFFGRVTREFDPYVKDPGTGFKSIIPAIEARLPGLSGNVPNRLTPYGSEVGYPEITGEAPLGLNKLIAFLPSTIKPVLSQNTPEYRVSAELGRLGMVPGFAGRNPELPKLLPGQEPQAPGTPVGDIRPPNLTDEQWQKYQRTSGKLLLSALDDLMGSPVYNNLTDEQKKERITSRIGRVRLEARRQLFYPQSTVATTREELSQSKYHAPWDQLSLVQQAIVAQDPRYRAAKQEPKNKKLFPEGVIPVVSEPIAGKDIQLRLDPKIRAEMDKYNVGIGPISHEIPIKAAGGFPYYLDDSLYQSRLEHTYTQVVSIAGQYLNSPSWAKLPADRKQDVLQKIITLAKSAATELTLSEAMGRKGVLNVANHPRPRTP